MVVAIAINYWMECMPFFLKKEKVACLEMFLKVVKLHGEVN